MRRRKEELTWEERVVALEGQVEQKDEELCALRQELQTMAGVVSAKDDLIESLREVAEAHKAAEEARRVQEIEGYLAGLKDQAVGCQSPIPAEDLDKVRALFDRGDTETAQVLGEAFLARSRAQGGGSFGVVAEKTVTFLGGLEEDNKKIDAELAQLRQRLAARK